MCTTYVYVHVNHTISEHTLFDPLGGSSYQLSRLMIMTPVTIGLARLIQLTTSDPTYLPRGLIQA